MHTGVHFMLPGKYPDEGENCKTYNLYFAFVKPNLSRKFAGVILTCFLKSLWKYVMLFMPHLILISDIFISL